MVDFFNEDFCSVLEYAISQALASPEAPSGFWCDGVMPYGADEQYSATTMVENKYATLQALVGKDGQSPYELLLHFGPAALNRIENGLAFEDCIPSPLTSDSFRIDTASRSLDIQLR